MATAYAAVTSLMHLIAQLHEHPDPPIKLDEEQVDSLKSKICSFQSLLEDHHTTIDLKLELRIADSAHAVEDLIETHIADRIPEFHESLQKLIEGFDRVINEAAEINRNPQRQAQGSRYQATDDHPMPPSSSQSPGENIVVGIDDIAKKVTEKLTLQHNSRRQIISISGMGGIGKTTLARKVYDSMHIKHHFHMRAWASVSNNDYCTKDVLVELFCCLDSRRSKNTLSELSEDTLGMELYKSLCGRKYLVVLDNVWDRGVLARLMYLFPTSPGSGIVITTRDLTFGSTSSHDFPMKFLEEDKSWELFTKKVFGGRDNCPVDLQEVGKNIAIKCRGLPLSIVVIGGHLANSTRTQKYWKYIENNLSSVVNSLYDGYCAKILSTSYIKLPVHLKPCFLYMAILPEGEEIRVSKLIRLWSAEGFLKPIRGKSIEEAAEHYINDLADRSLIIPTNKSSSIRKNIKRCTIHDLLRDFCIKVASENKFIYGAKKLDDLRAIEDERRIVRCCHMESQEGHSLPYYNASRSRALRTLIFEGELSSLKDKKLLRVLSPVTGSSSFLFEMLGNTNQLVNIRYLDPSVPFLQDIYRPPPSIYLLWNLQYLYLDIRIDREAPLEIWKMPQLKDVKIRALTLSDPPSESNNIMKNLQSAGTIINFNFSKEAVERIPNINKLEVRYDDHLTLPDKILSSIRFLVKLESLGCILDLGRVKPYDVLRDLTFPHSLRELEFSHLRWEDVTTKIGWLPLLEVLKLSHCEGSEWNLDEQKFSALKLLQLTHCRSLRYFEWDNHRFPCLRRLVLEHLDHLEKICIDIDDLVTLESLQVRFCPDSAVVSAQEIAEQQLCTGNDWLQVKVWLLKESGLSKILRSTNNFFVHYTK